MTEHECWKYENGKCKLGTIGTLTSDDKCPFKTRMECEEAHSGRIVSKKCGKCVNFVERHCDNDVTIIDEFSMINDTFEIFEERIDKLEEQLENYRKINNSLRDLEEEKFNRLLKRVCDIEEAVENEVCSLEHHIAELESEEVE